MFQLILSVDSHNLTGYKMHIAVPQICQINRWNNSFQNMYGMLLATIDRLARKIDFSMKPCQSKIDDLDFFIVSLDFFHEITF